MCLLFCVSSCQETYCLFNASDDFGCSLKKGCGPSTTNDFPLITSHLPVGKFLELSRFIARLWKSKLTPWSLPPPRVHVLLCGLCGGKVRPLWPSSPLHYPLKISFFPSTDGYGLSKTPHPSSVTDGMGGPNPPSVMRTALYG